MHQHKKSVQKERLQFAKDQLEESGIDICYEDETKLKFKFQSNEVVFFPFTGWYTGKSIKDGRGLNKLLIQLKK